MAPSKRHAPPASRASPDPAARGTPSPPAKGDKKASSGKSAELLAEKALDDASPVPAVAKRARSRGGRRMTPPEEPKKEATEAKSPEGDKNAEADALHWGRQKARGAEPVKGGGAYGQTVAADAADAADVSARANAPAALVGKAALLASSRDAAPTVLNDARAQTLFPELKRQSSADPDSVGFTSLLQLADAGVQLEKRTGKGVKKTHAERKLVDTRKASAGSAKGAKKGGANASRRGGDDDAPRGGKKRGRGPNKVQETEEEREAKRQRRVQANRESARQTIRRKHEQYDDLNGRASALEASNAALREEMATLFGEMRALAATNVDLRERVVAAAKKKGVPVPDIGDGAAAAAAAAATAPVVAAAPARSTHVAAARAAPRPAPGSQRGAGVGAAAGSGSGNGVGPTGSGVTSGVTQGAFAAPDALAGVPTAVAAAPFANGVAAALGGAVPGAAAWPGGPAPPAAMWGPFANVFGAMAAAARGTGAMAEGGAPPAGGSVPPGGSVPGGAPFFGNAPMMMPFFHPAMGMAAGSFAWPQPGTAPGPGATAPPRVEETSKLTTRPEPSQGNKSNAREEPARTPPA